MSYRVVCFDVDGTLLDDTVFIWETLHDHFQVPEEIRREAYENYFAGRITYAEWAESDIEHWKTRGVTRDQILEAIEGLSLMPGARETLETLRAAGLTLAVVSGTLDLALHKTIPEFGEIFRYVYLNRLEFAEDGRVSGVIPTRFDVERKGDGLRAIAAAEGVSLEEIVFVGDNFNDVSAAEIAGLALAFNCKSDELARVSDVVIPGKDLREILPHILGARS